MRSPDQRNLPSSPKAWLEEIRAACEDAREAIPFGPMAGYLFGEGELYPLAPSVALKFRGVPVRGAKLKRVSEAALASYLANREKQGSTLSDPRLAFAFCYLASHYALDLVDISAYESAMEYIEQNIDRWIQPV